MEKKKMSTKNFYEYEQIKTESGFMKTPFLFHGVWTVPQGDRFVVVHPAGKGAVIIKPSDKLLIEGVKTYRIRGGRSISDPVKRYLHDLNLNLRLVRYSAAPVFQYERRGEFNSEGKLVREFGEHVEVSGAFEDTRVPNSVTMSNQGKYRKWVQNIHGGDIIIFWKDNINAGGKQILKIIIRKNIDKHEAALKLKKMLDSLGFSKS